MARLDYANARIGARRGRLLGPAGLRALLARQTSEAMLDGLRAAPIGACLPGALGAGDEALAAVEAALRADARAEALGVLADAEGTRARALLSAFLGLEEAAAVKAVLRGVARGAPIDLTVAAAPAVPALPDAVLRAAAASSTLEAAVAALEAAGSRLAPAVREALGAFAQHGLLGLELAADRAAFARAGAAARGRSEDARLLSRHLADRVDARNAATLLALSGTAPAAEWYVPGGRRLGAEEFRRLAGAPAPAVHAAVAAAFPGSAARLARPWSAELALEAALLAPLRREARLRPLSLAVPLAYLLARRAEVRRVALVLRGAALGLPGDELLELAEA